MVSSLVLFLAALGTFARYPAVSAQSPSTVTISVTISPTVSGAPTSEETLTITLNPTPNGGPAFTQPPASEPAVPDDNPPCASFDALVSSCTTLGTAFYNLPLSGQAQCLCNVGPWDAVAAACFSQLTVLGQYYASSITSHGLLGLCSSYSAGPTWPASVLASISAAGTPATTSVPVIATGSATPSSTQNITLSSTQKTTQSTTQTTATGSGSFSLAQPSLLVWLLPWLLML